MNRQRKAKNRTLAVFAFKLHGAGMSFDYFVANVEAQSQAGKSVIGHAKKPLK
jgi:hypothetical protein